MRWDRFHVSTSIPLTAIMDPSRLLPRMTAYQKAVEEAKRRGGIQPRKKRQTHLYRREREELERRGWGNLPYGGSWVHVWGKKRESLDSKNRREFNRFLKKLDKYCKANPTTTFRFTAYVDADMEKVQDASAQLQLLGVKSENINDTPAQEGAA